LTPGVAAAVRGARRPLLRAEELGTINLLAQAVQKAEGSRAVFVMPLIGQHFLGLISLSNRKERTLSAAEENLLAAISRQVNGALENALLYEEARQAYETLRQAQEQLLQSEKMAALGQLVSGVAHELNNPLAAIIGYSQLLGSHVSPKGAEYVEKLLRQAKRTQKIIQDMLSFARQKQPERQVVDINRVLEDALQFRDHDLRSGRIQVIRKLDPALPRVLGDRGQLEQVCLNIISNACDAILEGGASGTLQVRSVVGPGALGSPAGRLFSNGPASAAEHVLLEFIDDGPGLKEPQRVFDPFYTTKKVGQGTGLGLSICYGIVKEHGGEIEADNHQPRGAVFRVRLPMAAAPEPAVRPELHELANSG
jgi:two-component system NtrC family sensor kinase